MNDVKIFPPTVIGTISPYPTVVIVETAHHIQANIELKSSGCTGFSKKYIPTEDIYKSIIAINEKITISRLTIVNAFFNNSNDSLNLNNLNNLNIRSNLTTLSERKSMAPDR